MLPFPVAVFDYVVNIGSLEHFLDMEQGVREMARVLKPDGLACVLLPNLFGLTWSVLRGWRTGDIDIEDRQPVQRFGTRKAWQRLLDTNGLKVQRVIGYERVLPASLTEWRLYLELPGEILLALLAPILPTNLQRCFIFLCRRS
jgi:SAM-dependent methyltransferase